MEAGLLSQPLDVLLIKAINPLGNPIDRIGNFAARQAIEIGQLAQQALSNHLKKGWIVFLNIVPQLLLFLQMLWACRPIEEGTGDDGGNFHMVEQVVAQVRLVNGLQIETVDQDSVDLQLLVNPPNHDLFIDRLVIAADKIAVKINRQVVHGFHSL